MERGLLPIHSIQGTLNQAPVFVPPPPHSANILLSSPRIPENRGNSRALGGPRERKDFPSTGRMRRKGVQRRRRKETSSLS